MCSLRRHQPHAWQFLAESTAARLGASKSPSTLVRTERFGEVQFTIAHKFWPMRYDAVACLETTPAEVAWESNRLSFNDRVGSESC